MRWQKILHARGWAGVNWPPEYGGTGWTPVQKYIFASECAFAHTPRIVPFGLAMVGPVIYTFGNAEQKARFLPDILASNVWWCQGYSEPNAGSDLASLRTSATRPTRIRSRWRRPRYAWSGRMAGPETRR